MIREDQLWNAVLSPPPGIRIKHLLDAAASLPELERSLVALIAAQEIKYYLFQGSFSSDSPDGMQSGPDVVLANAPAGWKEFCSGHAPEGEISPFASNMMRNAMPVPWRELTLGSPRFFEKALTFGLVTGITHIVHGAGRSWSLMSYMWDVAGDETEARIDESIPMGLMLASYAHNAVQRILRAESDTAPQQPAQDKPPALTPRQRECLLLAATGSTALQIAGALSISERAVAFHLTHARQRLGVKNSRQAYAKALSMGLISSHHQTDERTSRAAQ